MAPRQMTTLAAAQAVALLPALAALRPARLLRRVHGSALHVLPAAEVAEAPLRMTMTAAIVAQWPGSSSLLALPLYRLWPPSLQPAR